MTATRKASIVMATVLLGALLVNTVGQQTVRAEFFNDLNNIVIDKLSLEKNIGKLKVNFYVYADNPKTGNLDLWVKFRDQTIHKTINYATAKKYIGVHDGEKYAVAPFVFPPATRNLITDSFQTCVRTIASGEQICTNHFWLPGDIEVKKVYMEAYSSGYAK